MGEKQRKRRFCKDCASNPCYIAKMFSIAQPNRCPDFKPRPEVEKKPGCFENALHEPGVLACLSCDVRDECREKKWAEVEKP